MEEEEEAVVHIQVTTSNFDECLREFVSISKRADEVSAELKEIKAEQDALSYALAKYMMTGSIKSIVLDGVKFTQKEKVYSKVDDKEALRAWINDNDAVDLVMAVHPSKLTAYCNEQLEAGGDIPTGVNPNYIKYYLHAK